MVLAHHVARLNGKRLVRYGAKAALHAAAGAKAALRAAADRGCPAGARLRLA
jgi:hypothetical protein